MTNWTNLYGAAGAYTVSGVIGRPHEVKRAGIGFEIIYSGTPASNEVYYNSGTQQLTFSVPFTADSGAVDVETIYVLYKN